MPLDDPACFRLDCIPVRPIHWLWMPYLACDRASPSSTATPGAGKSLFTADLAARPTCGGRMPDAGYADEDSACFLECGAFPPLCFFGISTKTIKTKRRNSAALQKRQSPDEGKADRPLPRAASVLRPWLAGVGAEIVRRIRGHNGCMPLSVAAAKFLWRKLAPRVTLMLNLGGATAPPHFRCLAVGEARRRRFTPPRGGRVLCNPIAEPF